MTWRNSPDIFPDRICSALAYTIPLAESIVFARFVLRDIPFLAWVFLPALPLEFIYSRLPLGNLIVFLVLLLGVVRNPNINHFIRFNVMQAMLLDIGLFLISLLVNYVLNPLVSGTIVQEILFSTIFLGVLASVVYGMVQCLLGVYPDKIPGVSEAAHYQVPF